MAGSSSSQSSTAFEVIMRRAVVTTAGLALLVAAAWLTARAPAVVAAGPDAKGLTAVPGIRVGHHTLTERPTGCTVIVVDGSGAVGGISQRGGAPGTRETDLLDPLNMVDKVNAVVLSGGSAYGIDAAQGVVRYLEEKGVGWPVGANGVVPIVPAAILMDLGFGGNPKIRPTADCGYRAAQAASDAAVAEGNVGAGAGATVGKMAQGRSMKGGLGSAAIALPNGLIVGAIVAVNAVGDIIDPTSGKVVAGLRTEDGKALADVRSLIRSGALLNRPGQAPPQPGQNTTIGLVATNARLSKADVSRLALMADDGYARAIAPSHTTGDGDTVFALATGSLPEAVNVSLIGALAADVMSEAIVRAVSKADSLAGVPAARALGSVPARIK
jgi:L-aminopeptidase/D-esterase-like protein